MKAIGLGVPLAEGERRRRELRDRALLDDELEIQVDRGLLWLPLTSAPIDPPAGILEEREFQERPRSAGGGYRETIDLPEAARQLLPRSFDVIGDVVLVRLPETLESHAEVIGAALLAFVPGARIVGADGGVQGAHRIRTLRRIAGSGGFDTVHRENGLEFHVSLDAAYFSPRLAREHARFARSVRPGTDLLDLCCGVGPFGLTAARFHSSVTVTAVDSNPRAIELVRENAHRLAVEGRLTAVHAEAAEFLRREGSFGAAVLNLPHAGAPFLPAVAERVRPGGAIAYYEVVPRDEAAERGQERLAALTASGEWELSELHRVHEYSPQDDLVGYAFERRLGRSA